MRTLLRVTQWSAVLACLFSGSCERQPSPEVGRPRLVAATGAPVRVTIPPSATTAMLIKTLPNAECVVTPAAATATATRGAQLFTDAEGTGRFFVRPTQAEVTTRFVIRCEAAGKAVAHSIELRISATPTAEMPSPVMPKMLPPAGKIRPALAAEAALRMSDEELLKAGYPPPPDPRTAPAAHAAWLRSVTRPFISITPHTLMNSSVRHNVNQPTPRSGCKGPPTNGPATSQNWSGIELNGAAGSVGYVRAFWKVPSVTGETGQTTWSSTWIGIDGDGTNDLVQTGTEQDVTATDAAQVFTYRAWTEFLPQQPTESVIANFTVSPGDEIFAEMWIGWVGAGPDLSGGFGVFWLTNNTTGVYTSVYTPVGSTSVGGSEAEWIVERPTLGSALADLADYGTAQIYYAYARHPLSPKHQGYFNCCDSANPNLLNYTMVNGSTNLSTVAIADSQTMNFTWQAFH